MAVQIVMDHTGDTRHHFDSSDSAATMLAEKRFHELLKQGFWAVALAPGGQPGRVLRQFEPDVEQTLFIPHLQGG
ncbi:MAG: hypothetical protein ABWZ74_10830 [Hyphomicrobiaceae bacterium]|jgi:hypothetical protein